MIMALYKYCIFFLFLYDNYFISFFLFIAIYYPGSVISLTERDDDVSPRLCNKIFFSE